MADAVIEDPVSAPVDAPPPAPVEESGSLADHEALHAPDAPPVAEKDEPGPEGERDGQGRFKPRHRAASQRAAAEDVPRIADLTKKWRTTEAERDTLKAERETLARERDALKARLERPAKEPEPKPVEKAPVVDAGDPEPQDTQFETYGAFVKEQARWEIRQAKREEAAADKEAKAADAETARDKEFKTRTDAWAQRRDAFAAKTPDFAETAGPFLDRVHAGTPIGDALIDSELGPELALFLATHPDEAERIGGLSPVSAIRAIGRIESMLDAPLVASAQRSISSRVAAVSTGSAPALPRPSAPRPPNPVRTGSIAEPDTPPDPDDQSMSAHEKHYGGRARR